MHTDLGTKDERDFVLVLYTAGYMYFLYCIFTCHNNDFETTIIESIQSSYIITYKNENGNLGGLIKVYNVCMSRKWCPGSNKSVVGE